MTELLSLPAFSDNYIWMVHNGRDALVVDPGDADVVRQALLQRNLLLKAILVTHHHPDHTGGVQALRDLLQGPVYAPVREDTPLPREPVSGGQHLAVLDLPVQVIDVPGHTAGHIAYLVEPPEQAPILFCGDTLFSGGCGRLFEGTPAQMHASLSRLAALPGDTLVYCAHEYTASNLRFARKVEPDSAALARREAEVSALRAANRPTVPSCIAVERATNPFLRVTHPDVQRAAQAYSDHPLADAAMTLGAVRHWKDSAR